MIPLISIVVPTHNRSHYAISCIESVLAFDEMRLELVVCDSSTDGLLHGLLHEPTCRFLSDPRMRYKRVEEPSNLTKNHNDAMSFATGEYVIIIGDDDGITQAAIDAAYWAAANNVSAVSHRMRAVYGWPDFRSILARKGHAGRLYVPRTAGGWRWRSAADDLNAALARAFQATDEMPRCYHGLVLRRLMVELRARTGAFFHGSSPDMSGAVALACVLDRYVEVDMPLTIAGVSGNSNSGRSAINTHKGELKSETQTSAFEGNGWIDTVPKFFAVETVWAHAGLSSLQRIMPERMPCFNHTRLLALCAVRHPEFEVENAAAIAESTKLYGKDVGEKLARSKLRVRAERVSYLLRRMLLPTVANGRKYFSDLENIAKASLRFEEYSKKMGFLLPAIFQIGHSYNDEDGRDARA